MTKISVHVKYERFIFLSFWEVKTSIGLGPFLFFLYSDFLRSFTISFAPKIALRLTLMSSKNFWNAIKPKELNLKDPPFAYGVLTTVYIITWFCFVMNSQNILLLLT